MSLELLKGICSAASQAVSRLSSRALDKVVKEGAGGDFTKMIDLVAEEAAVSYLEGAGFSGRLLSEELGEKRFGSADYPLLVLDPIDGTTNATRGISFYCVSVAAASGPFLSNIYAGAVLELPSKRLFCAERGKGAYLDGERIHVKENPDLRNGLIGVDFNVRGNRQKMAELIDLCLYVKHSRNMGSAALLLCYVADGALDLYVDNRRMLRVTDIGAPYIILTEAGASVIDLDGSDLDCALDLRGRISVIAGPSKACREALSLIRGERRGEL